MNNVTQGIYTQICCSISMNKLDNEGDEDQARELNLFAHNDQVIYKQSYVPTRDNYRRKFKKGVFDREKAIEGLANNYVKNAIKAYEKQIGELGPVTKATRELAAKETLERMMEEIKQ